DRFHKPRATSADPHRLEHCGHTYHAGQPGETLFGRGPLDWVPARKSVAQHRRGEDHPRVRQGRHRRGTHGGIGIGAGELNEQIDILGPTEMAERRDGIVAHAWIVVRRASLSGNEPEQRAVLRPKPAEVFRSDVRVMCSEQSLQLLTGNHALRLSPVNPCRPTLRKLAVRRLSFWTL